jgi:negative regulator of flagellin synthesis FlgM
MKVLPSIYKILGIEPQSGSEERNVRRSSETEIHQPDIADLSEEGKLVAKAMHKLKEMPDIRAEKVEELARRIEQGEYNVPLPRVAEEMLRRLLEEI